MYKDQIAELINQGKTKKYIEAFLVLEGLSNKRIKELLKEAGLEGQKKKSFNIEYYAFLSSGYRTKEEAEDYILGFGEYGETSNNVVNHLGHYLSIYRLSVAIYDRLGVPKEEAKEEAKEEKKDSPYDSVETAYAFLSEVKADYKAGKIKKKQARQRSHPDKVAHLNNSALTKEYENFFKTL